MRMCDNPPQQAGGADCVGNSTEMADCNMEDCVVRKFVLFPLFFLLAAKETSFQTADFTLQVLIFVTTEKEGQMF